MRDSVRLAQAVGDGARGAALTVLNVATVSLRNCSFRGNRAAPGAVSLNGSDAESLIVISLPFVGLGSGGGMLLGADTDHTSFWTTADISSSLFQARFPSLRLLP